VFLLMTGGQSSLLDEGQGRSEAARVSGEIKYLAADRPALNVIRCTEEELIAHQQRLDAIEKAGGVCIWNVGATGRSPTAL
jgi:DNA polymerase-3 subunit epsilon